MDDGAGDLDARLVRFTALVSRPGTVAMLAMVLDELRDVPGEQVEIARRLVEQLRDAFLEEARGVEEVRADAEGRRGGPAVLPSIFDVRPIDEDSA